MELKEQLTRAELALEFARAARQKAFEDAAEIVESHVEGFYDPQSPKGYANHRLATAASNIRRAIAIETATPTEPPTMDNNPQK